MNILNELVVKQKMAICIVYNSPYNAHSESLLKKSKRLPLNYLAELFAHQFMQHNTGNYLPISFMNTWPTNAERCEGAEIINLHYLNDNYALIDRLATCESCPVVYFPKIWNDFSNPIRSIASKNIFKNVLKQYSLDKLAYNYQCDRLLCPRCHL